MNEIPSVRPTIALAALLAAFAATERGYATAVTAFGAKGDGASDDTAAIQRTIDAGGVAYFPKGVYLTGTLHLRSNGGLDLADGAKLLATTDRAKWNARDFCPQNLAYQPDWCSGAHLVCAVGVTNVFIRGGEIDGNGRAFHRDSFHFAVCGRRHLDAGDFRPRQMLYFCESKGVRIEGTRLMNSAYWNCFFHGCEDVLVRGVTVRSDADIGENDGIDIDSCRNVKVEGCDVETGDDGVAVRASPKGLASGRTTCENVQVANCTVRSHYAHALRIGVGEGCIRDCRFYDIRMPGTRGGIWLCSKYGGRSRGVDIRNVLFENIKVDATCWLFARNEYRFTKPGDPLFRGVLDGVTLRNVRGRSAMPKTVLGNGVAKPIGIVFEKCAVEERKDAMRDANERAFFLVGGEMEVERRRQARAAIEAGGAQAAERLLKDADAGIRRFALYSLYEADRQKGLAAAKAMIDDADSGVKALARELTRSRRKAKTAPSELPLSQNPANDHEVIRVKSISCEGESFPMPPKMECDEVEIWFGSVKEHLMVWINDVLAGEWDPVRDAGREFRIDVTKVVKWGSENKVWVTDERGKDRWMKFSVEVVKCVK